MADKTVVLKLELQEAQAKVRIKQLTEELVKLDGRTKEYKLAVSKLNLEQQKLNNTQKSLQSSTSELIGGSRKGLTGVSQASGGATTSVLELGRVVSDAPYGIRGMANNVSQLASNMLFTAQQIDATTGKTIGFVGVLKQMGRTFLGPLGLLFVIQSVIAAVDYFAGGMTKATEAVDDLNKSLDEQLVKFNMLTEFLYEDRVAVIDKIFGTSWKDDLKILNNEFTEFRKKYESLSEEDKNNEDLVKKLSIKYKNLLQIRTQITSDAKELKELQEDESNDVGRINALKERLRLNYLIKAEIESIFEIEKKTGGDKDKNEKVTGVGILTSEEIEAARIKQAEQVDSLFQDKFKLEQENAQYFIDLNKRVGLQIANDSKIQNAIRAEDDKYYAELRKKIAWAEAQAKSETLLYISDNLSNFSAIAGETTAAGKAFAIASATMDAWAGANKILNDPSFIGRPVARFAATAATITMGLANVKKILEVKVPSGGSSGGAGSVPSGRTFDFNLVGSTGVNQLAQTVGGQVSQPIKAYVVGSEITNQQAFDNQIQGQATIG